MNLSKAIELNEESIKSLTAHKFIDHANAIKLGNNALIFYQKLKALNTGEIQGNFIGED